VAEFLAHYGSFGPIRLGIAPPTITTNMKRLNTLLAKRDDILYEELFPAFCFLIELDEYQTAPEYIDNELCNMLRTRLIVTDKFFNENTNSMLPGGS
jgi:hypothetical protein